LEKKGLGVSFQTKKKMVRSCLDDILSQESNVWRVLVVKLTERNEVEKGE